MLVVSGMLHCPMAFPARNQPQDAPPWSFAQTASRELHQQPGPVQLEMSHQDHAAAFYARMIQ